MALEFEDEVVTILAAEPRKHGRDQDSPLWETLKLYFDLSAADVLPYFHPSLNDFLFCDERLRFGDRFFETLRWKGVIKDMLMHIGEMEFKGVDLSSFKFKPYIDPKEFDDRKNRIKLWVTASFMVSGGDQVGILAEMIKRELAFSIRPMQIELPEIEEKIGE